ncbi:MAG: SdpI family protein [Bacteroidetes bacterium]|nr:SdpI family protein [Bacteroidota bacterium]
MDKRTQIREYFDAPKPKFPVKWLLIGIAAIVIGAVIGQSTITLIFIVAGLLVGGIPIFSYMKAKKRYEARPSDSQMDAWLEEGFKEITPIGLKKLGFDTDEIMGEEIVISGPVLWQPNGVPREDIRWIVGKDGVARFSIYDVSIFYITEKGIGIYRSFYNFVKNVTLNDSTDEYFYKNITRVGTKEKSSNHTLPDGQKLVSSEVFNLDVAGNSEIEIVLTDPAIEKFTGGTIPTSRAEKAVQTIKKLVREKN